MASTKEYVEYILQQLSLLDDIQCRPMMGEYLIYYHFKVIGGIYDNRFLIKNVSSAREHLPNVVYEIPYPGAKEMLLVNIIEDQYLMKQLIESMYDELPMPKPKKKKIK
ncbi:MAG: competence protein TfoX [Coprobacillus cateniformis]|uniref:TfoX/Sxy family protein n=1 Tax=Longibaculum muris TaxID=1796628 RepID=UPI003AB7A3C5|nr:competence protein TfoX [Coprobacillus cateniformis]